MRGKSYKIINAAGNSSTEFSVEMIKMPASLRKKLMKSIEDDTNMLSLIQGLNYYLVIAYDNEVSVVKRRKKLINYEGKLQLLG